MYPDFVTCEDQPAHRTVLSALVCHSLFGGGGGGGVVGAGFGTANSISAADKGTG